jgi:hypothetical protein
MYVYIHLSIAIFVLVETALSENSIMAAIVPAVFQAEPQIDADKEIYQRANRHPETYY